MKRIAGCLAIWMTAVCLSPAFAQEAEDRTLLSWAEMRHIINEASGERALHHVLELVPYPRVRSRDEYKEHFRESRMMADFARQYGLSNVEIESFPSSRPTWHANRAELWMVKPQARKLYDVYDVAISIAGGSESGDVTAELVDVGVGSRPEDYQGKNVEGKIVLGSASLNALQRMAVFQQGAVGVISYRSLYPDSYPDLILSQGISSNAPEGKSPGFGWAVSARTGRELAGRLAEGQKVVLRSVVEAETFPGELEVVHAMIPGDGSSDQAIIVSAHLYEGYQKQGANDDNSGCGVTLEMGRALLRLVQEGKLPRLKRDVHFLWVPEISGTRAWLNKHTDIRDRLIADLNFDMEGVGLQLGNSFWNLIRTPDTFPSYLNDVAASVMEFIAKTNRERIHYRHNGYRFSLPVLAPNGSRDPFYVNIEKHYGASDHVVYLSEGIPAAFLFTWPDMYYHSSQDTPDKLDSTQLKRVAVVGTAAMSILSSADDVMASRIAAESLARGSERMGQAERKGLSYLADVTATSELVQAYKEARNAVRHQAEVEKAVVRSAAVLFGDPAEGEGKLSALEGLVGRRAEALQQEVKAYYELQAQLRRVEAAEPVVTEEEKRAARLIPERIGGGGSFRRQLERLSEEQRQAVAKVPVHMQSELNILIGQRKTVLEIRDFLSGEFEPLPLRDLMDFLEVLQEAGTLKLVEVE